MCLVLDFSCIDSFVHSTPVAVGPKSIACVLILPVEKSFVCDFPIILALQKQEGGSVYLALALLLLLT